MAKIMLSVCVCVCGKFKNAIKAELQTAEPRYMSVVTKYQMSQLLPDPE